MSVLPSPSGPSFHWFEWAGLHLLALENEHVRVVIWPDHGADLIEFRHKASGLDALWKNPRVNPPRARALDQPHAGRSEFYDVFHGGWFVSLPNGFFPGTWPDPEGPPLGCHGELQHVTWSVEILHSDPSQVAVRAVGRGVRTPLRLERTWRLRANANDLLWEETLHNESPVRLPVAWLHHPTFGGPLITGAEIVTPARTLVVPPTSRPGLSQLQPGYEGPWPMAPHETGGDRRDCSRVPLRGDPAEHVIHLKDFPTGWGAIWNDARQLGFGVRWDEKVFPYLWSWSCGRGGACYPLWGDCHTVTLQPSTSPLLPFDQLVRQDQVRWLAGGASVATALRTGFIRNRSEVFALEPPPSPSA